jgi:hypothetical protein
LYQSINVDIFGETMKTTVQTLKSRIDTLETELIAMQRMLGATMEKKDSKAWDRLHKIGKQISLEWKSDKTSWQLISEARR